MEPTVEQLNTMNQPPKRSRLLAVVMAIVPIIVIIAGLAIAWFTYPPLRQTANNLLGRGPQAEPSVQPAITPDAPNETAGSQPSEPETETEPTPVKPPITSAERDRTRYKDINIVRLALADYFKSEGEYPETMADMVPTYLTAVPEDPLGTDPYTYRLEGGGYTLRFVLEGDIVNLTAGEHVLTPTGYDTVRPAPDTDDKIAGDLVNATVAETPAVEVPPPAADTDSDGDGLTDARENQLGSDPRSRDTDGDGLEDGAEVNLIGTNPLLADSDGDGFNDKDEMDSGFDPTRPNAQLTDKDEDGLWDLIEVTMGLNPNLPDGDGDGLADGDELNVYGTHPQNADSDNDSFTDGDELAGGYNPLGTGKITPSQSDNWLVNRNKYGLHQPTIDTLGLQ